MKARGLLLGLLVLLAGLLAWGLSRLLVWEEVQVQGGYQGEARVNDFLAAQRLLERLGQPATSLAALPRPSGLPPSTDLLLLPRRRMRLAPDQVASLLAWVRAGGLLVAEAGPPEPSEARETADPLLAALGARHVAVEDEASDIPLGFRVNGVDVTVDLGAGTGLVDLGGRASARAGNARTPKVLQYDLDRGRAILFTRLSALANDQLGAHDHAVFLAALARRDSGGRVWIIYRERATTALDWLRAHGGPAALGLGLFLAALWLRAGRRFGPLLPAPAPVRRSLLEHLAAAGRFQWRHREGRPLLLAARTAALRRLARRHPGLLAGPEAEWPQRLAAFSGLDPEAVFRALRFERHSDPDAFTDALRTLDHLRKLP